MQRVPILELDDATAEVRAVYADFHRRMSFPAAPNFIKTLGHSLSTVEGTWGLVHNVLVKGKIPRYIKEMLFVAISKDRQCNYCEAAHIACCRMLGVDKKLLDSLIYDIKGMADLKTRDMIMFGLKCSRTPQELTDADIERLRSHRLSQSEIVELIAMSGLAVYVNIMADACAIEPDAMFHQIIAPANPPPIPSLP